MPADPCDPGALATSAECFVCLSQEQRDAIKVYLLRAIAGLSAKTPNELSELAKCFQCVPGEQLKQMEAYLLCQIVNV